MSVDRKYVLHDGAAALRHTATLLAGSMDTASAVSRITELANVLEPLDSSPPPTDAVLVRHAHEGTFRLLNALAGGARARLDEVAALDLEAVRDLLIALRTTAVAP